MTILDDPGELDPRYWSNLANQPLDRPAFARMFGASALRRAPGSYHLMLFGEAGGLDILFGFDDLLHRARLLSRHEEAFAWAAMSSDATAVHCSLLDGLVRECAAQAGFWPALAQAALAVEPSSPAGPPDSVFTAFSLAAPGPAGFDTLAAVEGLLPTLIPLARVSRVEPGLSLSLARVLPGARRDDRSRILAAASDAIAIAAQAQRAPRAPSSRL